MQVITCAHTHTPQEKGKSGISDHGGHTDANTHTDRGWEGQWGMGGAVGDGRGSRGWEGQWGMGGVVGGGRGSRGWEGQ